MRLTNCFCTNSICTPSRAAILTGQYSHKNGVYTLNDKHRPGAGQRRQEIAGAGLSDRDDREMASADRSQRLRLLEYPARPGTLLRSGIHREWGKEKAPGLLHRPNRRFHAGMAGAARSEQAVLPDVPPQGPASSVAARSEIPKMLADQEVPEPSQPLRHLRRQTEQRRGRQNESRRGHHGNGSKDETARGI